MTMIEEKPKYITETFEPKEQWVPFRLVNESLGIAHTILEKMRWADISREVLRDGTSSSALAQVVRGERRSINGWRCEWIHDGR